MNFLSFRSLAALRTPANPWDTRTSLCVECVLDRWVFSLISGLPSSLSTNGCPSLFK